MEFIWLIVVFLILAVLLGNYVNPALGVIVFIFGLVVAFIKLGKKTKQKEEEEKEEIFNDFNYKNSNNDSDFSKKSYQSDDENTQEQKSSDSYEKILPMLIALCISADRKADEAEVLVAEAFIENDKFINDNDAAVNEFKKYINKLVRKDIDTSPIFKMLAQDIHDHMPEINDKAKIARLLIVLNDMCECGWNRDTGKLKKDLLKKLNKIFKSI